MTHHILTHATNKDHHPGRPDMPALCWSSEAVQNDLATQRAAAIEAKARQQQNIWCVAEIENELQERSIQHRAAFAQPTSKFACKPKHSPTVLNVTATPQGQGLVRSETLLDVIATSHGKVDTQETTHTMVIEGECQRQRKCTFANDLGESDSETEENNSLFIIDTNVAEAEEGSDGDNHQVQALPRKFTKKGKAVHHNIETAHKQLATGANVIRKIFKCWYS